MKTKIICSILCLLLLVPAVCTHAEEAGSWDDDAMIAYGYQRILGDFMENESYQVRACYSITLPEDMDGIAPEVVEAYAGYSHILLVEYGYCIVPPILESVFGCVGVGEDGEMELLPGLRDILAKTYDYNTLNGLMIEQIS